MMEALMLYEYWRIAHSRHQVNHGILIRYPLVYVLVLCSSKALQCYSANHIDTFTHRTLVGNCLVHVTGLSRTRSGCIVTAASPPLLRFSFHLSIAAITNVYAGAAVAEENIAGLLHDEPAQALRNAFRHSFKLASQTARLASRGCWWICQHRWPMGGREPAQQAIYWDMHVFCIHQSTRDCGAPPTEAARGAKLPTIFGADELAMTWMTAPEPVLTVP
ncbi:uncharacterized protein Triagg1_6628 [Trichoderma aggressivum f. europaeum]|uniref:Uncharacterized protein n=1 Tax=Trichoderma aggressivum f. europaeum TaxID=173218 RepID=A0AAE1LZG3_9HYPO|nr:hypothetical protein Triagg1_6628 [Trichoderma aggressivum f. europaeum]